MKDAYYFSHDSNASKDPKILAMFSVYGMAGYGWYWIIIEMLREQTDYKMDISGTYSFNAFAMPLLCDAETSKKFILDCINEFKLFNSDGTYFWSESLIRRMKNWEDKSKKARQAALIRWGKNADAIQTHSERNAKKVKESKVKESKVKEKKEEECPDISQNERDCLNQLKTTPSYPFKFETDLRLIRDLLTEFPDVKILEELKKWAHRKKFDDKLTATSKPRSQLRNWMIKGKEFNKGKPKPPPDTARKNKLNELFLS